MCETARVILKHTRASVCLNTVKQKHKNNIYWHTVPISFAIVSLNYYKITIHQIVVHRCITSEMGQRIIIWKQNVHHSTSNMLQNLLYENNSVYCRANTPAIVASINHSRKQKPRHKIYCNNQPMQQLSLCYIRQLHGNGEGWDCADSTGIPLGWKEMLWDSHGNGNKWCEIPMGMQKMPKQTHFTVMLLLLCVQWHKKRICLSNPIPWQHEVIHQWYTFIKYGLAYVPAMTGRFYARTEADGDEPQWGWVELGQTSVGTDRDGDKFVYPCSSRCYTLILINYTTISSIQVNNIWLW